MTPIARSSISIPPRQRSEIATRSVADLKDSILRNGLLNPPVVEAETGGTYRLIAGETRLRAIDEIAKEQKSFFCGTLLIEPGTVPVSLVGEQSELSRTELEFDENWVRTQPSWPDRVRAMASIQRLRQAQNPLQTQIATARELVAKGVPSIEGRVPTVAAINKELSDAAIVEPHLNDPIISKARSLYEAVQLVYKREDDIANAELVRRRRIHADTHASVRIEHGDLFIKMKEIPNAQVDLILSDPPYGINAHNFHKGDRSAGSESNSHGGASATNLHGYSDTPDEARRIYLEILREGFRCTKPKANVVLFIGFQHFNWLLEQAKAMGWKPWPRPLLWQKSQTEGLITGWGRQGFILTYDVMFFATKGQRGLNYPHVDIFNFPRVPRKRRVYAAEKPVDLMKRWIELCTLPGDFVLDPCAGSGSTLVAARDLKRSGLGFELMQDVCDLAEVRLDSTEDEFDAAGDDDEEGEDSNA